MTTLQLKELLVKVNLHNFYNKPNTSVYKLYELTADEIGIIGNG